MKGFKKLGVFVVLLLLALLVQACGSGEETGKVVDGKKVLELVVADDGIQGNGVRHIAEKYEKENPGIKVNLIEMPYGDMKTKITMMIQGGNPPALARVTDAMVYDGALANIDADSIENVVEALQGYTKDKNGNIISLPITSTANGILVNVSAFKKAGIEIPTEIKTWDEIQKILQTVAEKSGTKYALVWDKSPSRWSTILYQYGGSFFSNDLSKGNFETAEAKNALTKFKELHDKGIIPKSVWVGGEDSSAIFKSGMAVAILSGSWKIAEFDKDIKNFDWKVMKMPKGIIRSSVPGGNLMVAFKGSKMEDEANKFMKFMIRDDVYKAYLKDAGFMSSFKGIEVKDVGYNVRPDAYEIFSDELNVSPKISGQEWSNRTVVMGKVHPTLTDDIVSMIQEEKTVDQVAKEINELINKEIEETK